MSGIKFVIGVLLAVLIQDQAIYASDKAMKEWTFLVFMNGHNNLDPFTDSNLKSMQEVGSTDDINIVVQAASLESEKTHRLYVKKGSNEVIESMPRVDMGDYKELKKFIDWTVKNYPAKKYFINIWNHGSGWHDININKQFETMDSSFDDISGNFITTEQVGDVMDYFAKLIGHKVDLYGNDACLMAMAEIAAEFSSSVSYMASSQDNEPGEGWPYAAMLKRWTENPKVNGDVVGKILTEEYYNYYGEYEEVTTFSVINVSKLNGLMKSLGSLSSELISLDSEQKEDVKNIAISTHSFYKTDYKDLFDFITKLENRDSLGINKSILSDIKTSFKSVVIKSKVSEAHKGAHGLSVWLPTFEDHYDNHIKRYKKLEFDKKTGWSEVLDQFFN